MSRRVAVLGGGWAGLAAAVEAASRGHVVSLFEASRALGGRARTLEVTLPEGGTVLLDNGQHILVGAYLETLRLMEKVGVDTGAALLRLPLVLQDLQGNGLRLPAWPAPWDAAAGILRARGWSWRDKLSLLRASAGWQLSGFRCDPSASVAELSRELTARVRDQLVEPLCIAALNTPAERASAEVFLRVLRDALFGRGHGGWGGSNLLLPRQELGRLFPDAAQRWLLAHGAQLRLAERAHVERHPRGGWAVAGQRFDDAILATQPTEAARLVRESGVPAADWLARADALAFEAIATVYATGGARLPLPMLALPSGEGAPAQFVFDRGQLGGPPGLLAFVVSASHADKDTLEREVIAQAAGLGWKLQPLKTIVEKRATFACVPGLRRPAVAIAPGLWACGDYVEGPYPATLEGAVRAGLAVAERLGS